MKSCFFIGHRNANDEIYSSLAEVVEKHITEHGVTEFIVGHYGRFDSMAARVVIEAKKKYPNIKLLLLLPYHPAERQIKKPEGFDDTYHPMGMENVLRRFAIVRANRYMIDNVDYLISYAWHPASNARELTEYAPRREQRGELKVTVLNRI